MIFSNQVYVMRYNKLALYLHFVWATWDREPLILPTIERRLYRCIAAEVVAQKCSVLALNGTTDHIHLLVSFHSTITVATFVKQIKGTSSHFANHVLFAPPAFKWQGGYGVFSVSSKDIERATTYIANQKYHHAENTTIPNYEMYDLDDHDNF